MSFAAHRVTPHVGAADSLGELLLDALRTHPSATLLIEARRKSEGHRLDATQVRRQAMAFAAHLQALGVGPGDRVAIIMSNQSRWPLSALAVFWAGAVLVPLDYKLTGPEQADLLRHSSAKAVIIEFAEWRKHPEGPPAPLVLVSEAPDDAALGAASRWEDHAASGEPRPVARSRDDLACIVYSSGTGGRPKGCQMSHGAYLAQLEGLLERFPMAPGDVYFSILPSNHAIDFMVGFVGPFVCGATVVHQRTLRPEMLLWTMQRYQVTHMAVVPLILKAFQRAIREKIDAQTGLKRLALDALIQANATWTDRRPDPAASRRLLAPIHEAFGGRLRLLFCGGAFTDRAIVDDFYRMGLPVVVGYGLTEACTVISVHGTTPFRSDGVGRVLDQVEVKVDQPGPDGVGEICVRGPTLMMGYLHDPEQTAAVVRDGWLHTGDLGLLDASHHLHLVGRRKDVIVTEGGKNIYPEDIERAFADLDVEELTVFAANTLWPARTMQGEQLVVVLRPKDGVPYAAALAAANRSLPDFKRVAGVLVWAEAFPRTASMKLQRAELVRRVVAADLPRSALKPVGA